MDPAAPSPKLPWWLVAVVALALGMLTARLGWRAYCCQVVASQAATSGFALTIEPLGPGWLHRVLGRRWGYLCGDPQAATVPLEGLPTQRAASHVVGCLTMLATLKTVRISGPAFTDTEAAQLRRLPALESLGLADTAISPRGLAVLDNLPHLTELALDGSTQIDDAALVAISRCTTLVSLSLAGTNITDEGLRQLSTLVNLESLQLDETQIGDAGLAELRHLKKLRRLSVSQTRVSTAGIEQLCHELTGLDVSDD